MGRPYLQYIGDRSSRYCCKSCNCDIASSSALLQLWEGIMGSRPEDGAVFRHSQCCDVASSSALLWEGIMGSRQPAVLLRETVNVETFGEERKERLSTGRYTLIGVSCRGCYKKLGWHYLAAVSPDQKYKEGCCLIEVAALRVAPARPQECDVTATAAAHRIAVQC